MQGGTFFFLIAQNETIHTLQGQTYYSELKTLGMQGRKGKPTVFENNRKIC